MRLSTISAGASWMLSAPPTAELRTRLTSLSSGPTSCHTHVSTSCFTVTHQSFLQRRCTTNSSQWLRSPCIVEGDGCKSTVTGMLSCDPRIHSCADSPVQVANVSHVLWQMFLMCRWSHVQMFMCRWQMFLMCCGRCFSRTHWCRFDVQL